MTPRISHQSDSIRREPHGYFSRAPKNRRTAPVTSGPEITIIMPIHNERATIEAALDVALGQVCQGGLEVVVVDGMSSDGTREILQARALADPRLRVFDNPARLTPQGLNIGLAAARGTYWVRLDGHSLAPLNYAERLVEHLRAGRCEAAGGVVRALGDGAFGRAVAAAHDSRFGIGNARHHYATKMSWIDHVTHGAYRVDISRRIGGFDEELVRNQDFDFDARYRKTGARLMIDPAVTIRRRVRERLGALARQHFEYGYWKWVVLRRHPGSLHLRWLAPPVLVLALMGEALFSWTWLGQRLLAVSLGAYAFMLAAGAGTLSRRVGVRLIPHSVLGLVTIHVSWGSGFLWSILRRR